MIEKLEPGSKLANFTLPRVGGGIVQVAGQRECWQLLIVYGGRHCLLSKRFLNKINQMLDEFTERNVYVIAISSDPADRAGADVEEFDWKFDVGYGLAPERMRQLGTYISAPRSKQETEWPYSEPALIVLSPDSIVNIVNISNTPFSLPDLRGVLSGIAFIQDRSFSPGGTWR